MLLSVDNYQKLIGELKISDKPYLFSYLLDESEEKINILKDICNKLNLPVRKIKLENDISKIPMSRLKSLIYPSIQEWLASFAQADFVVTDSFHGTVFSIIFNKPFVVLPNKGRGVSRFESLLKTVGLLHKNRQDLDLLIRYYKCSKSNFATIKMQQNETLKKLSEYLC